VNRNVVYAGCLSGLVVTATLFYPLYSVLPTLDSMSGRTNSETFGIILALIAGLGPVGGGLMAARWGGAMTRLEGAKMGALAGGIGGIMTFAALGAAAGGILGLGNDLEQNVETQAVHAIVQTAYFTYAALWGMLFGGAALGALGGALYSPRPSGEKQPDESATRIAEVLSIRLLLVNLLILIVSVATTPMLLSSDKTKQLEDVMALFNASVGSGFVFYLAIMLWILRLARNRLMSEATVFRKRQVNGALGFAAALSLLALSVMVSALLFNSSVSPDIKFQLLVNPLFLTGALATIALSSYALKVMAGLANALRVVGQPPPAETAQPPAELRSFVERKNIPVVAVLGGAAFALPPLTLVPLVINLAWGVMPAIAGATVVDIRQDLFYAQILAAYGVFLVGAVSILGSMSMALGLSKFRARASARR